MGVGGTGVGGRRVDVGGGVALGGRVALGVKPIKVAVGVMAAGPVGPVGPAGLGMPPLAIWVSCATAVSPAESVVWAATVWAAAVWMLSMLTGVGNLGRKAEQPLKARVSRRNVKVGRGFLACMGSFSNHLGVLRRDEPRAWKVP
jgi:hypothetical protein